MISIIIEYINCSHEEWITLYMEVLAKLYKLVETHIENGWGEGRFPNHLEPCMQSTEAWESTACSEKTGFPCSWNLEWIYVGVGRKCGKMQEKTDEIENKVLR